MQRTILAPWLLTAGLAAVFAYFGIDAFWHPVAWMGWIPAWMDGLFTLDAGLWLQIIGAFELLCAALIVVPIIPLRKTGCLLMAAFLLLLMPFTGLNDLSIRDFGLMMGALSLWASL